LQVITKKFMDNAGNVARKLVKQRFIKW
jgi:hypothetical protein